MRKLPANPESLGTTPIRPEPDQASKETKDLAVIDGASGKAKQTLDLEISSQVSQALRNRCAPSPIGITERFSSRQSLRSKNGEGGNHNSKESISHVRKRKFQHKRPELPRIQAAKGNLSDSETPVRSSSARNFSRDRPITQNVCFSPRVATEDHTSKLGTSLSCSSVGQDSVACALSQAARGEWIYKHIGGARAVSVHEDAKGQLDEISVNNVGTGPRHKRWVWISPSERSVSWSRKPPNAGVSLRRNRIQNCMFSAAKDLSIEKTNAMVVTVRSVLDVKNNDCEPRQEKDKPPFNRCIVVLASQRAIRLTALTAGSHHLWLMALAILAHLPTSARMVPVESHLSQLPTLRSSHHEAGTPEIVSIKGTMLDDVSPLSAEGNFEVDTGRKFVLSEDNIDLGHPTTSGIVHCPLSPSSVLGQSERK